ncbi:MAG: outer membrane beta-barrel protein [Gammaproteobacteria bacterium]|nr:outer membrane beta-barrel protein [Gammaproteobacteria bacterium]
MKMRKLSKLVILAPLVIPFAAHADWTHHTYAGVGGGWQQTSIKINNDLTVPSQPGSGLDTSTSVRSNKGAGLGNAFVGMAFEQGAEYWAIEADAIYSNATADTSQAVYRAGNDVDTYQEQMPWRYELDGIMGHYFEPNLLGYFKVGVTSGQLKTTYNTVYANSSQIASFNTDKQLFGGVVGLGAQYAINSNWNLGVEADYIRFGNAAQTVNSTYFSYPASYALHYKPEQYMVKATVAYRFN